MSYSEIADRVERQGYKSTFIEIYNQYVASKARYEEAQAEADKAKSEMNDCMTDAHNLVHKAAQNNMTIEEDGCHVVRSVIGSEVVHFRTDGEKIFIGYWPLTKFKSPKG